MVDTEQPAKPFTAAHLALGLIRYDTIRMLAGWEQPQILLALMILSLS